ncbi:MAG: nuclear transport factor 2 family protein [Ferrovibrio sp.]|uniref:nuclear transport factor 2 family protein n=1 Tax=Ferrovibrio sp. TaxID=1917215 RepID=UPI00391B0681
MDAIAEAAEAIVQKQLDAYNARNIEAFMACWAEEARIYEFPNRLLADGAAEIRARHMVRFQEPDLFGRLVSRMSVVNRVIDREVVTRNFPEGRGQIDVIGIYELAGRKIAQAWFIMGSPVLEG